MIPRWLDLTFILSVFILWRFHDEAYAFPLQGVTTSSSRNVLPPTQVFLQALETKERTIPDDVQDVKRSFLLRSLVASLLTTTTTTLLLPTTTLAFEGGVGGLGKTKPQTGVILFEENSTPIQNERGIVSAEIQSTSGKPILIEFQTPWPLLPTTSGLEARNLRTSDSAFIQLVPTISGWENRKVFEKILMDTVLASQGKFGAYGTPTDVRVKPMNDKGIYSITMTCYTPAMRESERQLFIRPIQVDDSLVMLVTGTIRNAFPAQEPVFSQIADSFVAVAAPESRFRTK